MKLCDTPQWLPRPTVLWEMQLIHLWPLCNNSNGCAIYSCKNIISLDASNTAAPESHLHNFQWRGPWTFTTNNRKHKKHEKHWKTSKQKTNTQTTTTRTIMTITYNYYTIPNSLGWAPFPPKTSGWPLDYSGIFVVVDYFLRLSDSQI